MTLLDTVSLVTPSPLTVQERARIEDIEQHIRDNYTIQLAINHHLISLDCSLSATNIYLFLNIYIGNTTTLIDKIALPIKLEPATPFDTEDKLQASVVRRLTKLVTISDSMIDLEQAIISNYQAIISNYNNKLIEY